MSAGDEMGRNSTVVVAALCTALAGTAALADSAWATRSELGYALARGNSDTENGNFKFGAARLLGRWQYNFGLDGLYGASNGINTAERWDAHLQTDLKLNEHTFWFGALRYEDDRFGGFQYQASLSSGFGHIFMKTDTNKLSAQIGAGVRQLRPEELVRDDRGAVIDRIPGERADDGLLSGSVAYQHSFNPSTKLIEGLLVESGRANTSLRNSLALQVKMSTSLALAVGWQVNRNSSPPPGVLSRTDTLTTVNLVYEIKDPKITPSAVALTQLMATAK